MTTSSRRFWIGAGDGVIATLAMSCLMVLVYLVGASAMPEPMPIAPLARLIAATFRTRETAPGVMVAAIPIHLAYGGFWAGLVTASTRRVTWWKGLALGVGLWAIFFVFFVPMAGLATFRVATTGTVWISTLVLHLVYGVTFGLLAQRQELRTLPAPPD
jgi:hypothetical protein